MARFCPSILRRWPRSWAVLVVALTLAGCKTGPAGADPSVVPQTPAMIPVEGGFEALPGAVCRPLEGSQDPDIQRWRTELDSLDVEYCVQQFRDQGITWVLQSFRSKSHPTGPVFFLPHDDENAAFAAAVYALKVYGGGFMAVSSRGGRGGRCRADASESRCNCGIDPNRNFTMSRSRPRSCRSSVGGCGRIRRGAPGYTKAVRTFFEASPFYRQRGIVMALHNNANGYWGDGEGGLGDFSILRDREGAHFAGVPFPGALNDEDNVLLTSGKLPFGENSLAQGVVRHFNQRGINVHYEHVQISDCSLSNEVTLNEWAAQYYNIESEQGDLAHQVAILDALMGWLQVPLALDLVAERQSE